MNTGQFEIEIVGGQIFSMPTKEPERLERKQKMRDYYNNLYN